MRAPIPEERLRKRYPASPCLIISGIFFRSLMKLLSFFLCTRRVSAKFSGAFIPSFKKSDGEETSVFNGSIFIHSLKSSSALSQG